MRWEQVLPGGDGLTAFEASMVPVRWRDHNGERGLVPTSLGPLDWQFAVAHGVIFDRLRARAARPRRAPTGCGPFARGTFRVRL